MNIMVFGFGVMVAFAAVTIAFPQGTGRIQCGLITCGNNSRCMKVNGFDGCVCNPGFFGSGYGDGCTAEPQCRNDTECNDDEFCNDNNLCALSCIFKCPADSGCIARNHGVECYNSNWFSLPRTRPVGGRLRVPRKNSSRPVMGPHTGGATAPAT